MPINTEVSPFPLWQLQFKSLTLYGIRFGVGYSMKSLIVDIICRLWASWLAPSRVQQAPNLSKVRHKGSTCNPIVKISATYSTTSIYIIAPFVSLVDYMHLNYKITCHIIRQSDSLIYWIAKFPCEWDKRSNLGNE